MLPRKKSLLGPAKLKQKLDRKNGKGRKGALRSRDHA